MRTVPLKTFSATFREGTLSAPSTGGRVFKNVTIIKAGLGNAADRHFYPSHVLKEAVDNGQFEKLRAYADHPSRIDETVQPERTIRDMVGLYTNVRFVREGDRGGRVVGDLKVFRSQKWLSDIVDDLVASGASDKIGISINGQGDTEAKEMREAGGPVNEVQNFRRLDSADIVTEAGAGGGFHTLQEAARAARQERMPMSAKKSTKDLLAKIAEAAADGNVGTVAELSKQLEAAMAGSAEPGTGKKKVAEKKKPCADDEMAEADAVAEADVQDDDVSEADADEDADDVSEAGADEDADDVSEAGADEDADEPADDADATKESMRTRFSRGTKVHEVGASKKTGAAVLAMGKGRTDVRGAVKAAGAGSATKHAGAGPSRPGRRYAEAGKGCEDTVESLREALQEAESDNKSLRAQLARQTREAAAKRIVAKVPGLNKEGQRELASKLVRECRTVSDMERDASFVARLMESAVDHTKAGLFGDEDEGSVEGMPSRFREGYGSGGDSPEEFVEAAGLPVRKQQRQA